MKRSLLGCLGFFGSYRITAKKSTATMSAAEQQLDGCPLPASEVARTLSIRRVVALFWSAVINAGLAIPGDISSPLPFVTIPAVSNSPTSAKPNKTIGVSQSHLNARIDQLVHRPLHRERCLC